MTELETSRSQTDQVEYGREHNFDHDHGDSRRQTRQLRPKGAASYRPTAATRLITAKTAAVCNATLFWASKPPSWDKGKSSTRCPVTQAVEHRHYRHGGVGTTAGAPPHGRVIFGLDAILQRLEFSLRFWRRYRSWYHKLVSQRERSTFLWRHPGTSASAAGCQSRRRYPRR